MKKFNLLLLAVLAVTFLSCTSLTGKLQLLDTLKENIASKLDTGKIDLELINNEELIVVLKDPKFQEYSPDEKKKLSFEIGIMASNLELELEKGQVKFVTEINQGLLKTSDAESFEMFE